MNDSTYFIHSAVALSNAAVALVKHRKGLSALRALQNSLKIIEGESSVQEIDHCLAQCNQALHAPLEEHKSSSSFDVAAVQVEEVHAALSARIMNASSSRRQMYAYLVERVPETETNSQLYKSLLLHNMGVVYLLLADSCDNTSAFIFQLIRGAEDAFQCSLHSTALVLKHEGDSEYLKSLSMLTMYAQRDMLSLVGLQ